MALQYRLEYNKPSGASDDAVYIHLRKDPDEYYRFRIGKETYEAVSEDDEEEDKDALANGLFAIRGVVEIAVTAYRIWYMKAPAYQWEEVNTEVLDFLLNFFGEDVLDPLPGSAQINGNGIRLGKDEDRRSTSPET